MLKGVQVVQPTLMKSPQDLAARIKANAMMDRQTAGLMPYADAAPELEIFDGAAPVDEEIELAVLLTASDPVVIVQPNSSVVGAGRVVISAAATVTFCIATPLFVYTQRHFGVSRWMKSPVRVASSPSLTNALV
jgi:hypothetical protein